MGPYAQLPRATSPDTLISGTRYCSIASKASIAQQQQQQYIHAVLENDTRRALNPASLASFFNSVAVAPRTCISHLIQLGLLIPLHQPPQLLDLLGLQRLPHSLCSQEIVIRIVEPGHDSFGNKQAC